MSPSPTVGAWRGEEFAHEAFVYDTDDAVRRRCVPYVEEGLDLGQAVVLVASRPVRDMLLAVLGDRLTEHVTMQAAEAAWHGAPATLASYQESMPPLLEAGEPWRLIGEPVWLTYPGGERWSRYEAVANVAFAHYPYYSLCLHDTRHVPHQRVEHQLRTHPLVWDGGPEPNDEYVSPATYLRSVEPPWTPTPGGRGHRGRHAAAAGARAGPGAGRGDHGPEPPAGRAAWRLRGREQLPEARGGGRGVALARRADGGVAGAGRRPRPARRARGLRAPRPRPGLRTRPVDRPRHRRRPVGPRDRAGSAVRLYFDDVQVSASA